MYCLLEHVEFAEAVSSLVRLARAGRTLGGGRRGARNVFGFGGKRRRRGKRSRRRGSHPSTRARRRRTRRKTRRVLGERTLGAHEISGLVGLEESTGVGPSNGTVGTRNDSGPRRKVGHGRVVEESLIILGLL